MLKQNNLSLLASILLLIMTPFVYFLAFNSYGYFNLEIIIVLTSLISLGMGSYFLCKKLNNTGQGLILATFITLSTSFLPGFQSLWMMIGVWLASLFLYLMWDKHFTQLLTIVLTTFLFGILFLPMPKQLSKVNYTQNTITTPTNKLPPIVHLVLDEHIGIEGIPKNIAQGEKLQKELSDFYLNNGFAIEGGAYSHYLHTYNSLPNTLNFTTQAQDSYYFKPNDPERILKQNAYFDALQAKGYQVRVYQADYINFCNSSKQSVASCYTYPAASVTSIQSLALPVKEKTLFLLKSFIITSSIYEKSFSLYQYTLRPATETLHLPLPKGQWYQARTCNIPIIPVISKLINDIKQQSNNTVFFAHLLIPHNPYIYNANCEIDPKPSHWRIDVRPLPLANDEKSRAERYVLYENQIRCSQKLVSRILDAMKHAGIYENAFIIVQGDHGSRIMLTAPSSENKSQLNKEQLNDAYSALFAVKTPGQVAVYKKKSVPLEKLVGNVLEKVTGNHFAAAQSEIESPYVYLVPKTAGGTMEKFYLN